MKGSINIKSIALFILLISGCFPVSGQQKIVLDTITNTHVSPFDQICYQEIFRKRKFLKDRSYQSTGFLISQNVVLTAAHNVFSNKLTKVTKITLFPCRHKEQHSLFCRLIGYL